MNLPTNEAGKRRKRGLERRLLFVLPLLCLIIFGTIIGARLIGSGANAGAESLTTLKGQIPGLVKQSTLLGPTDSNQSLSLSIGLRLRNASNLQAYVDASTHAKSVIKGHLTPAEIAAGYAPLASSQQSLITYMQGYGFQVAGTLSQHLIVDFQGTVSDAENAFHIKINNYSSPGGKDFYAPSNDPSVPLSLSEIIQSITGLDNALHYTHPPTKSVPQKESHAVTNSVTCPTQQAQPPYLPDQITSGYNIDNRSYIQGDGQTIALVEFDDYNSSDISVFTHCYGGSSVPLQKILVDNGSGSAPGQGAFEVEMDMELLMTAAPHLAGLDIYEAPNTEQGSNDMWARIINNDVVNVISTSWGMCEQLTPTSDLDEENALFTIAAAQGQTIVAASGDSGPNDCTTGDSTTNAELAVDDPASQPYVLGVGGTSLSLASDPARVYNGEEVWSNQTLGEASGGGISNYWPMPNWQQGPGVINSYSSGTPCGVTSGYCREVPDVALDADANTGYLIYCTVAAACSGSSWWSGGGTSAGAPLWAAFIALANEKTLHDGGWDLGFVNPYLYQIAQNADGMSYSLDFHDITVGFSNGRSGTDIYPATTGYDLATGLGSFNALYLANSLDALSLAQNGKRGAPGNSLWYFAEGAVGGGFEEFLTIENPTNFLANVQVQYLFTGQPARSFMHGVSPNSRLTVSANTDLKVSPGASHLQSISVIVSEISNIPIVVERPMYFNFRGVNSGSDVIGTSNVTHTNFYFAQGDASLTSNNTTREYITVLNPQTTAATITATFYSGGKLVDTQTLTLPPLQRGTMVTSYHHQAAIQVTSTVGVVVERPMYVTANIAAAGGTTTGAASIIGATNLASEWLFAEGNTGSKFQEYLVISNFTTSAVQASVKLEYTNGTSQSVPVTVNAQSQLYYDVNNANKNPQAGCGCTPTNDVAADITGDSASLVVERVTYFHYNGESGLTDVLGQPGPASKSVYGFAEGTTVGQFQEFLALSNPTAKAVQVAVTMLVNGSVMEQEVTVPAYTCEEININTIVKPMIAAYAPHNADVSIVVQSFGGPVVAERVMYFSFHTQTGGTDIIGYTGD